MAATDKDTIYIDIDDEITGIIDKVKASSGKVVALVLPKRAAVFQSIVNMKLLKRAADASNKHLVLITSEAGLLPLAGAAGVHVARTLTSKPEIPVGPELANETADEAIPEDTEVEPDPLADQSKTLAELAGGGAAAGAADYVETVVLDDDDLPPEADDAQPVPKSFQPPAKGKNKKLKIPDFDRFRLLLIGGGLLLLLLVFGFILANAILPKAVIKIKTDATNVDASLNLNLSTSARSLDPSTNTLPAKVAQTQKTYSQQVPTTGQKNNGEKAVGSVNMTATECTTSPPGDVPAGTGISHDGLTYITQENTSFSLSSISSDGHGCFSYSASSSTDITAQSGGSNYNAGSGSKFAVAGRSDVSASGSADGGTDRIVQTVSQNDINNAKSKINTDDKSIKNTLKDSLKGDDYYAISATYSAGTPKTTTSANVGDAAGNVTVTEVVTYTMFGVHQKDLETLINNSIKSQIDTGKQSILDNGLAGAVFNVDSQTASKAQLTMSATAEVGPEIDTDAIKQAAAGKKPGEVKDTIAANPDVTSVDVKLSPFWVSSVPKSTSKIKIEVAKPQTKAGKTSTTNAANP